MTETLHYITQELKGIFPENEIRSLTHIIIEHVCSISYHHFLLDKDKKLSAKQKQDFYLIVERLKQSEPIQYILGKAYFYDLTFKVNPTVLIPRPETEELVDLIIKLHKGRKIKILDIGTGSGCIAITLAKHLPEAEVWAIDISEEALKTAEENTVINKVNVKFIQADIFAPSIYEVIPDTYHIIVSNPPYVWESEKNAMDKNVLDYEPPLALFVPDNNPLCFYRTIAQFGKQKLRENGFLYFEINARSGIEMTNMLKEENYHHIRLIKDIYGKDRITEAQL